MRGSWKVHSHAVVLATVLTLTIAGQALGEGNSKGAAAETVFSEGRALMKAGNYAKACTKFEASQRMDPASGTLLNLALCYEKAGKTASAWATFKEAASMASKDGHDDRVAFANDHASKLEGGLSRLTVKVDSEAGIEGLEIRVDNIPLEKATWGTALPVDPGEHRVSVTAPGRKRWETTIFVGDKGDAKELSVPVLATGGSSDDGAGAANAGGSGRATWGFVVGGVGLVALGVGGYFGMRGLSRWNDKDAHCDGTACDAQGVQAAQDASTYAYISDVGVGVGLVGVGVGTYLLLTGSSKTTEVGTVRVVPRVGKDTAGLAIGGAW